MVAKRAQVADTVSPMKSHTGAEVVSASAAAVEAFEGEFLDPGWPACAEEAGRLDMRVHMLRVIPLQGGVSLKIWQQTKNSRPNSLKALGQILSCGP